MGVKAAEIYMALGVGWHTDNAGRSAWHPRVPVLDHFPKAPEQVPADPFKQNLIDYKAVMIGDVQVVIDDAFVRLSQAAS